MRADGRGFKVETLRVVRKVSAMGSFVHAEKKALGRSLGPCRGRDLGRFGRAMGRKTSLARFVSGMPYIKFSL